MKLKTISRAIAYVTAITTCSTFAITSFAATPATSATIGNIIASQQTMNEVGNSPSFAKRQAMAKKLGISYEELSAVLQSSVQPPPPVAAPATSLGAPMGFGASYGQAFAGLGGVSSSPGASSNRVDGSAAAGFGLGNANKYVGVGINVNVTSVNTGDGGFGADGLIAAKIHRNLPWHTGIAVGTNKVAAWGDATADKHSVYVSASKVFFLRPNSSNKMPVTITLGGGNGIYRSIADQNNNRGEVGIFGAVSLGITQQIGVIFDSTANLLSAGFSVVPVKAWPVTITVAAFDLAEKTTSKFTVTGAIGYSYRF